MQRSQGCRYVSVVFWMADSQTFTLRWETTEWRLIAARSVTAWLKENSCCVNVSIAGMSFQLNMCVSLIWKTYSVHTLYVKLKFSDLLHIVNKFTITLRCNQSTQKTRQHESCPAAAPRLVWKHVCQQIHWYGGIWSHVSPSGSGGTVYVSGFVDKWTGRTTGGSLRVKVPLLVPHDTPDLVNWLKQLQCDAEVLLVSEVWNNILGKLWMVCISASFASCGLRVKRQKKKKNHPSTAKLQHLASRHWIHYSAALNILTLARVVTITAGTFSCHQSHKCSPLRASTAVRVSSGSFRAS